MNNPVAHRQIILNGNLAPAAAAHVSPLSDGFMYGLGLFETIKVLGGSPVFFKEHFERLRSGAAQIGLEFTASVSELHARSLQCIEANQLVEGGLKIMLFQDIERVSEIILTQPAKYPAEIYSRGFQLKTIPGGRRENRFSSMKTLNYLSCIVAKRRAQTAGFDDALFVGDDEAVLEGATSNVFVVKQGTVVTPALAQGVLPGIVRGQVLGLVTGEGSGEGMISVTQLAEADEVFVTNSLMGVMPVSRIDAKNYRLDRNPITKSIMGAYQLLAAKSAGLE